MTAKKVVLAFSGGLDTSVIVKWLQETYGYEVICFTADIGQGDEVELAREKAKKLGVNKIYIEDLRDEFVSEYVYPMLRTGAIYEDYYLLGTAIARPLIAKRLVEIAAREKADFISHGATGKGNDQVRFELGAYALNPNINVIAPWRIWDLDSREDLLQYAQSQGISVDFQSESKRPPYSMDANLLHISYEGDILEDPSQSPDEAMWRWVKGLSQTPDTPKDFTLTFEKGDVVAINEQPMQPAVVLEALNGWGAEHGVGRIDIVENRYVGIKSRGCYETPGGTILYHAHNAMESITLDKEIKHLKFEMMGHYTKQVYNGYWWSNERILLQNFFDQSQNFVSGKVKVRLHKGHVLILGRSSNHSLFNKKLASFESNVDYNQKDAEGFININAVRLKNAQLNKQ